MVRQGKERESRKGMEGRLVGQGKVEEQSIHDGVEFKAVSAFPSSEGLMHRGKVRKERGV